MTDFTFASLEEFNIAFRAGTFAPVMQIEDKKYQYVGEYSPSILDIARGESKHLALFETEDKQQLVLAWGLDKQLCLRPLEAKLNNIQTEERDPEIERKRREEEEARKIGVTIEVKINGLNQGEPIKAKVDTGATTCSLDAQDIHAVDSPYGDGQVVTFTFRDRQYRTRVANYQSVRTADAGVQNRPTVKFSVTANGQTYSDVEFNLNDRSGMEYDVLIGMNFLSKTDLIIDPQKESIDWPTLNKLFEGIIVETVSTPTRISATPEQLQEVLDVLYKYPNVTLKDIAQKMKLDSLEIVEKLQS
jgi:hypothetical protein